METYKASDFESHGVPLFVQDNHSRSTYGVLRGLHYQKNPHAQGKLVSVVIGSIFDVAVDIRQESPTFGRWVAEILSAENRRRLYVPPGFAHGFCVTSETAEVIYKTTAEYAPDADRGFAWDDPSVGVTWPIAEPIVSEKDAKAPHLTDADNNFVYAR